MESRWPGGWGPQGMLATGGGGLARVPNLRVCKHPSQSGGTGEEEGRINILPWCRLVGVAETSSETRRRENRAARKGKWSPRATGNRQAPPFLECAQVTVKAGENGQHSGEMGGSSPWTRPSAPGCGDTLKALAGDQLDRGWGSSSKTASGSLSTGSPAGRTPLLEKRRDGSMYSQAYVRAGKCCGRVARA